MNNIIEKIISLAEKEVGTKASKDYTCKYTEEYGYKGAWCVMFIWWLFKKTNASNLFYDGKKIASCTYFYNWALSKGLVVKTPKRGDIIIFKFTGKNKKVELHMGYCTNVDEKYIYTIDGNTCASGDEYNGGEVMKKKRNKSYVLYIIRPEYEENAKDEIIHTVSYKGESLWAIAVKYYGNGSKWKKIYEYNNLKSTVIKIGDKLIIPKGD